MSTMFSDLFFHAAASGGLVAVGALAVFLLPWRDEELAETTIAFHQGWRLLDRVLRNEADEAEEGPPTSALWQPAKPGKREAA